MAPDNQHTHLPLVTVVTPSFNQGRFIHHTIKSVLSQNYPNLEYIVMDGGSTDETLDILKSYGDRLQWVSGPDGGQTEAINKGWKRSKGDILAWLNSDDIYQAGAIEKAVTYFVNHPEIGVVYGEGSYIDERNGVIAPYPTEAFSRDRLFETCFICQPACFIRRNVPECVGYLDESLHYCMDYDLWIRAADKFQFGYLKAELAQLRLHGEAKSLRARPKMYKEALDVLYRYYGYVPPSWACGYAYRTLEASIDRSTAFKRVVFLTLLAGLCGWTFLRYNHRMPISEIARWKRGFQEGMRKLRRAL